MVKLRGFQPDDLSAVYAISLATGHAGNDAARIYRDPQLMGHICSAPYALLAPDLARRPAAHVGVNTNNDLALGFWRAKGFQVLDSAGGRTIWLGREAGARP
jgi:ribosomal protein S18 acetylase RimI-like enzyme